MTSMPGAAASRARAAAAPSGSRVCTLSDSAWAPKTGTRTQVAVTLSVGSAKILTVSSTIFCSSLVEPSLKKLSMWGRRLKAMRCG